MTSYWKWDFQIKMADTSDEFMSLSEATITDSEDGGFDQALRDLQHEDEEEQKRAAQRQIDKGDEKRKERASSGGGSKKTG